MHGIDARSSAVKENSKEEPRYTTSSQQPGPPPGGHPTWDSYRLAVGVRLREKLPHTPPPDAGARTSDFGHATNKVRSTVVPPKKRKKAGKRLPTGSPIPVDQDPIPERPAPVEERPEDSQNAQEPAPPGLNPSLPFSAATQKRVHDGGPRPQPKAPTVPFQRVGLLVGPQKPIPKPAALRPWNIVAKGGKMKLNYVEAAATWGWA